jgi:hypothetical protein
MKKLPIIWGIILVLLLSSITPIASMKLNDGWVYDEDAGILSIEFSGETEESYIIKYGLIGVDEVGVIFTHNYSFPEGSIGYIETSFNKGEFWIDAEEFNESSSEIRYVFTCQTSSSLWIRFTVKSDRGDGFWRIWNIDLIGDTTGDPPKTHVSMTPSMWFWHYSPVEITLESHDEQTFVKEIHYISEGKENIVEGNEAIFTITSNGIHRVIFWSIDSIGNEELPIFLPSFGIDTEAPYVKIEKPINGIYLFGNRINIQTDKTIIIGNFDIEVTAYDNYSGISKVQFRLDDEIIGEKREEPYKITCKTTHTGKGEIKVYAEDFLGWFVDDTIDIYYYNFF